MPWQVGKKIYKGEDWVDEGIGRDRFLGRMLKRFVSDGYTLRNLFPVQGGWGDTWLAEDRNGRKVVIKTPQDWIFSPQYSAKKEKYLSYFETEAAAISACKHDHIVKLEGKFYLTEENNRPCIVMEYVAGMSVWERVGTHGAMSEMEALAYIGQISDAVSWLHQSNYLHHDINPNNIMIREITLKNLECQAVLIDFGLAKRFIADDHRSYYNAPGMEGFIAPEALQAYRRMDMEAMEKFYLKQSPTLDVYSLAATLYFMLTARTPLQRPRKLGDEVSQEVKDAIDKGLATNPEDRSASVDEWLALLPLVNRPLYCINNLLTYEHKTPDVLGLRRGRKIDIAPQPAKPVDFSGFKTFADRYPKREIIEVMADDEVIEALLDEDICNEGFILSDYPIVENDIDKSQNDNDDLVDDFEVDNLDKSEGLDPSLDDNYQQDLDKYFTDYNSEGLRLNPVSASDYDKRGYARHQCDLDLQGSISDYNEAIRLNPNFSHAYFNRGHVKSALGDNEGAIADFSEAIRLNPNFSHAYFIRAMIRGNTLGDLHGQIADLHETIRTAPDSNSCALEWAFIAGVKQNLGDYKGAIDAYTERIRIDPEDANSYNYRGCAKYNLLGDKEGAISDFTEAIHTNKRLYRNNSVFAYAYFRRGIVKFDLGDKEGAFADYNEAVRFGIDLAEAYVDLGEEKNDLGDKQGAIADYNEAIRLNPNYARAYNKRGSAKFDLRDEEGAIADYNESIRINPDDHWIYSKRGYSKYLSCNFSGAIADYNEAIRLHPDDFLNYTLRGLPKTILGDKEGAIADYNEAIRLNPDDAIAYYERGNIYEDLEEKQKALADFREASRLYKQQGETPDHERVENRIREVEDDHRPLWFDLLQEDIQEIQD